MALANRRPVAFPVTESASSSPSFVPRRLSLNSEYDSKNLKPLKNSSKISDPIKEQTPELSAGSSPEDSMEGSPTSSVATSATSVSSGSVSVSGVSVPTKEKKEKIKGEKKEKTKTSTRQPIATGISTTIPVTGERPRPQEHKSLDDNVLFAIFEILFERDPEGQGMTVKQICDILVEQHPEMATLSSKTSNLVSAKLNAYVKRVEKGEKSLIYALSREWADASPKRMVYVYRGLLADDYSSHALAAIESQKMANDSASPREGSTSGVIGEKNRNFFDSLNDDQFMAESGNHEMKRRATAFDLGINKNTFADVQLDLTLPQIVVPYSAAPVTASLGNKTNANKKDVDVSNGAIGDLDLDELENFEGDDDDDFGNNDVRVTFRSVNKRSKSMSYLQSKKIRTLTIAAAAPRLSKVKASPAPSGAAAAAAATAALQAAALGGLVSPAGSSGSSCSVAKRHSMSQGPPVAAKWLKAVRDGFLTQEIENPEDISLAELDSMFT